MLVDPEDQEVRQKLSSLAAERSPFLKPASDQEMPPDLPSPSAGKALDRVKLDTAQDGLTSSADLERDFDGAEAEQSDVRCRDHAPQAGAAAPA